MRALRATASRRQYEFSVLRHAQTVFAAIVDDDELGLAAEELRAADAIGDCSPALGFAPAGARCFFIHARLDMLMRTIRIVGGPERLVNSRMRE